MVRMAKISEEEDYRGRDCCLHGKEEEDAQQYP